MPAELLASKPNAISTSATPTPVSCACWREIAERFAKATGIPLTDLTAALLPLLAEPMAEIVGAVLDGRGMQQ